jgi:hypothetical protein
MALSRPRHMRWLVRCWRKQTLRSENAQVNPKQQRRAHGWASRFPKMYFILAAAAPHVAERPPPICLSASPSAASTSRT